MINPIRRVWVPKKVTAPAVPAVPSVPPAVPAKTRNMLFEDMPEPDVEEKDSDSIWAEFDSVPKLPEPRK